MTPKLMSFYTTVWFLSACICMILEGSYLGTYQNSAMNDLMQFSAGVWWIVPYFIPSVNFFRGIYRLLIWDYSFYQGGYTFLRYFWAIILTPGAVWGIGTAIAPILATLLGYIIPHF